jgi:hypothetical protein
VRLHVNVDLSFDTYEESEAQEATERMIVALRATADLFEKKGIYNNGSAETQDGTRIRWTAEQQETRQ